MPGKSNTKGKARRSGNGTKKAPVSHSVKAQTLYPVGRLNRYLKTGRYSERIGASAGAFMAAVLEYVTGEILELAGDLCHEKKMKTIQPRHINLGIRSDEELNKLIGNCVITEGGQHFNIHAALLPPKKGKKAEATQDE